MTSVLVTCPVGSSSFARATADEFTPGVLTVTWLDPEPPFTPAREFGPKHWLEATVYDEDNNPVLWFVNTKGFQTHERFRAIA